MVADSQWDQSRALDKALSVHQDIDNDMIPDQILLRCPK